jgi:ribose-phosphate pyrophosphokinase
MARKFAEELHADLAIIDKRRRSADHVEVYAIIGDVKSRHVLLVDDIWSTGSTLKMAAQACLQNGALSVTVAVTHGLFLGEGLKDSGIDRVYVADTIPRIKKPLVEDKFEISYVPTAPLFAAAIDCVVKAKSITSLFTSD